MNPNRRMILLVLAVAALAMGTLVVDQWLPLRSLPDAVGRLGLAAPVVGVAVGAALLVALIPRTPVSLACGLIFGAATGVLCALVVALTAAAVTFAAGRWLGRDWVSRHAGRRWVQLQGWIARDGVLAVAAVRVLPIGPYGLVGYAYGTSAVRVRDYALGTLIAATPSAISYALIGAAVATPGDLDPLTLIPLAFGLLLSASVVVRARQVARRAVSASVREQQIGELAGAGQER